MDSMGVAVGANLEGLLAGQIAVPETEAEAMGASIGSAFGARIGNASALRKARVVTTSRTRDSGGGARVNQVWRGKSRPRRDTGA
jgi:hypothetical protein